MSNSKTLPSGWTTTSLDDLFLKLQYGFTASAENTGDGPRFLRITDITSGKIDWTRVPTCSIEHGDIEKYRLNDGDFVFARTGSIEKSARIRTPPKAVFASYLIRGCPKDISIVPWLESFFLSTRYINQAISLSAGIGRQNLNAKNLGKIEIEIPPLPEQHRIVEAIESYFTRLDDAVATLERVQRNLKRYRASVLKAAVEGRLVPTEAELARQEKRDYEPASKLLKRILIERRKKWEEAELAKMKAVGKVPKDDKWKSKYKEPAAPDTTNLPSLPEGWCWASVEQLGDTSEQTVLTGPFGTNIGKQDFCDNGVPVLTIGCLTVGGINTSKAMYVNDKKSEELHRYRLRTGDILFSRMATVGRAGLVTHNIEGSLFNYHIMRLRINRLSIDQLYFINYIRGSETVTRYVKDVNHGMTRDGINTEQLLKLPIPLPPRSEQSRIIEKVDYLISNVELLQTDVSATMSKGYRLRQSILKWAFEGKLANQDPNDEPASVLMERIINQREEARP